VAPPEVVDAWRADIGVLSTVLARSFDDDPLMQWLCPVETRRTPSLVGFFRAELESTAKRGRVVTTADRAGAALWAGPGQWKLPLSDILRIGPAFVRASRLRTVAAVRLLTQMEKIHPRSPHWYLAVLGTDPRKQGRGVGGALVTEIVGRCDAEGIGAYLESSKERNVPFYRRFGFEVSQEIEVAGSPPLWAMWREPR
jgi:GNAT superfamily N-acetyltransferase